MTRNPKLGWRIWAGAWVIILLVGTPLFLFLFFTESIFLEEPSKISTASVTEFAVAIPTLLAYSAIGLIFALPIATGATIAAWLAYAAGLSNLPVAGAITGIILSPILWIFLATLLPNGAGAAPIGLCYALTTTLTGALTGFYLHQKRSERLAGEPPCNSP